MSSLALCLIRRILPVRLFRQLAMHVLKSFGNPLKVMLVANNIITEIIPLWHTSSGWTWLFARRLDGRWKLVREKSVVPNCCPPDLRISGYFSQFHNQPRQVLVASRQQVRCWPYNCFNLARAGGSHKVQGCKVWFESEDSTSLDVDWGVDLHGINGWHTTITASLNI